jgi:DNA-binding transcriptional regulator YbjK
MTLTVDAPANERRVRIADAALELLASEGARGLTHRGVDARLRLPGGSTSYYFRTRAALLLAAAERLLELDMADVAQLPTDAANATRAATLVQRWLLPESRTRSLARMELLLAAARDPELEFMARARNGFIDRVVGATRGAEADEARVAATALIALVDGLTLHGLVTGSLSRSAAQRMLERLRGPASGAPAQGTHARRARRPKPVRRAR